MSNNLNAPRRPPNSIDVIESVENRKTRIPPILDLIWVIGLMVYIAAGMPLTPFHADESMTIYTSEDFWTVFIDQDPQGVITNPPYNIDSDAQLRILNGSVNRYTIGLAWYLRDESRRDIPNAPGWNWGLSYEDNINKGFRVSPDLLNLSRLSSTIFLMLCIPLIGWLGRGAGGRLGFFVATALFAFSPPILLNGRRALQEGSMLFFGLLTIGTAALIAHTRIKKNDASGMAWLLLAAAGGLTIASKHTGVIFVVAALGWILIGDVVRLSSRRIFLLINLFVRLVFWVVLIIFVALALLPALWNENVERRVNELLTVRSDLLTLQTELFPETVLPTPNDRLNAMIEQPFIAPPMYYEAPSWSEIVPIQEEIAAYEASPLSGIRWGQAGTLPTVIAFLGIGLCLINLVSRKIEQRVFSAGMLVWLIVTVGALSFNPLEWQRYYLPLMPIAFLLVSCVVGVVFTPRRTIDVLAPSQASPNDVITSFR